MALVKRLVKGSALTYAEADGNLTYLDNKVTGSIDSFAIFNSVNTITGSNAITKNGNQITIDGGLTVTGDLTAMQYIISSSVTHFTESFSSGSTIFGDSIDDTHQFTGSVLITGSVTANTFIGDGSGLTNLPSGTSFRIATGSVTASVDVDNYEIFKITSASVKYAIIRSDIHNAGYGENSLNSITTGYNNTGIGSNAVSSITSGIGNTALGANTLQYNLIGNANTAIGTNALNYNTGSFNTVLGYNALSNSTSGSKNTVLGYGAGENNILGSYNVFIGYQAGASETSSNKLYIANTNTLTPLIKGDFTNTLLQLNTPTGGTQITGSLIVTGSSVFSGSATGIVNSLSISSNTASLDLTKGNFFTLQLVGGSDTYINPTNIKSGQTVCILINTVASATVSFPASVLQQSGSSYIPNTSTGKDIITLVSFDTSNLYLTNVKNLI